MRRLTLCCLLPLALAACADGPVEEPAEPVEDATLSEPQNIIAPTDFASLTLGGTIQGPLGPEVEASLVALDAAIGDIASRVQCPEGVDPCNPDDAEDGTIYTYVHEIRPGFDGPNDAPFEMPENVRPVESASSFSLAFPAHGFTGVAGYSVLDAENVLAEGFNASISCVDDRIIWSFPEESGWSTGETITFFWQSTQPPSGPDGEYRFVADGLEATGPGPMPTPGGEIAGVCE
ncbi:hypothetical protein HFP57_03725 [Parasphingopyxis algicola]|uniref:hypothetical protein n=1 Tax=Parasphingopyxis algicola TaxID=2026624 RepID=UPI0015A4E5BC|nr:hypothetical protein [Parasphingopyxis algicola]QLC24225.1 hypothetical protein HFP57_03725 [Parasphingopyxis algicola]